MGLRKRFIHNLLAGAFGRIINALNPLLLLPTFLNCWGSELYGEWLIVLTVPSFLMLAPDLGICTAATNRMITLCGGGNLSAAQSLFRSSLMVSVCASGFFVSIGGCLAALLPLQRVLHLEAMSQTTASLILIITCLQLALHNVNSCFLGLYACALQNARISIIMSVVSGVELIVDIVALRFGASPLIFAAINFAGRVVCLVIYAYDSNHLAGVPRFGISGASALVIRPLVLPGLGTLGMLSVHALQNNGMIALLGMSFDATAVTQFQVIRTMLNGFKSIFTLVGLATLAELPHAIGSATPEQVGRLLQRVGQLALLLGISAVIGTWCFGQPVISWWTGSRAEYAPILGLLYALSILAFFFAAPAQIYFHATNQFHNVLATTLPFLLLSLLLMILFRPIFGLATAGLSVLFWEASQAIVLSLQFKALSPETWKSFKQGFWNLKAVFNSLRIDVQRFIGTLQKTT